MVWAPDHPKANPNGYVFEHRLVWEKHNGPIPEGWHVHHLDRNRSNNDPANLVAMPAKDHGVINSPGTRYKLKVAALESEVANLQQLVLLLLAERVSLAEHTAPPGTRRV